MGFLLIENKGVAFFILVATELWFTRVLMKILNKLWYLNYLQNSLNTIVDLVLFN